MEQVIYYTYVLFMFITGLMFGSFFTLATFRIPRKQDIVHTRSYCPNCKHKLEFLDLIPILSYVSTIGRCRYCKKQISLRYPFTEFLSGMVFLIVYLYFGFTLETFILLACYVYLYLVIGTDIMKSKMTEEEKAEVNKVMEEKRKKKAGAINIEILVAAIILVFYFLVAVYITSNYASKLTIYKRKTDALNLCTNLMNIERAKSFQSIASSSNTQTIDNTVYSYSVDVSGYVKDGYIPYDNAKVIVATVEFTYKGESYNISLKALRTVDML